MEGRLGFELASCALEDPSSSLASEMYIFHLAEKLSMQPAVAWMKHMGFC